MVCPAVAAAAAIVLPGVTHHFSFCEVGVNMMRTKTSKPLLAMLALLLHFPAFTTFTADVFSGGSDRHCCCRGRSSGGITRPHQSAAAPLRRYHVSPAIRPFSASEMLTNTKKSGGVTHSWSDFNMRQQHDPQKDRSWIRTTTASRTMLNAWSPVHSWPSSSAVGPVVNGTMGSSGSGAPPQHGNTTHNNNINSEAAPLPPVAGDIRRLPTDIIRARTGRRAWAEPRAGEVGKGKEGGGGETHVTRGNFVDVFRDSAPYIRAYQGAVMVAHIGGDVVENPDFFSLMDDWRLLSLLGVRTGTWAGTRVA